MRSRSTVNLFENVDHACHQAVNPKLAPSGVLVLIAPFQQPLSQLMDERADALYLSHLTGENKTFGRVGIN